MKITPAENFPQMAQNAVAAYDTTGIAGISVASNTPTDGQVISYNSNTIQYEPTSPLTLVTITAALSPVFDTQAWMPLTTVVAGVPELVWDANDSLIPTLVPLV